MPLAEPGTASPGAPPAIITPEVQRAYWKKTSGLMWTVMALWFLAGFVVHLFAPTLNTIHVFGFPLAYYIAAQGSLIVFVVALWWFARRQNQIDEEFGVQEDE